MKVEDELDKSPTGWFAGGPNPTMADYMMSFGLEAAAARVPNLLGPKTKAWVERVHERYALFLPFLISLVCLPKLVSYSPAFKRVSACFDRKLQNAKL